MQSTAKRQEEASCRNSFGFINCPFSTLLASDVTPFSLTPDTIPAFSRHPDLKRMAFVQLDLENRFLATARRFFWLRLFHDRRLHSGSTLVSRLSRSESLWSFFLVLGTLSDAAVSETFGRLSSDIHVYLP